MTESSVLVTNQHKHTARTKCVFQSDVTSWGRIHVVLGVLLFLAGLGILSGNVAARTIAVILAGPSAMASFAWLPYDPVWSIAILFLAVAMIWALTIHGRDITEGGRVVQPEVVLARSSGG